jgi:hypothetical protein
MSAATWISILLSFLALSTTYFIAYKQGHFKKIKLHFSPSKYIDNVESSFFYDKKNKIPVNGIVKYFNLKGINGYRAICSHIFLSLENKCKYAIEDISITLNYPRKYFDENDKDFFKLENPEQASDGMYYTLVDDFNIQTRYKLKVLNPLDAHQFVHPMLQPIPDFNEALDIEHPYFTSISKKDFSFYPITYSISAKNLSKPLVGHFWIVSVLNVSHESFFKREKLFIHELTKDYSFPRNIFEIQKVSAFYPGKYKKDILVAKTEDLNISYSHFPKMSSPFDGNWNFEKAKV